MVLGGAMPVGSSCVKRLDPLALPVRFTANDARADERMRDVLLDHERVVVRRELAGIRMAINVPVSTFLGVALRMAEGATSETVELSLEHRDPSLSVPLYASSNCDEVMEEWRLWARVLKLPLLVANADGSLRDAFERGGHAEIVTPALRRRRRTAIQSRRPRMALRRKPGRISANPNVHREEREIIARD